MLHLSPGTRILNENPVVNNNNEWGCCQHDVKNSCRLKRLLSTAEAEAAMPLPGNKAAIICINSGQYCHHDFALTSSNIVSAGW